MDSPPRGPGQTPARSVLVRESDVAVSGGLDLEGVRRREPAALGHFFEAYFDRVFSHLWRLLGERGAAEDAAQDVFLKVHRSAHLLDPARDPGPWLITIATNVCRDLWRSGGYKLGRSAASLEDTPGLSESLAAAGPDPEADALAQERARIVRQVLAELRPPLREVVVLREYEGMGYDQIAAITGLNEAAVRKRYSRALSEMGKELKKAGL